MQMVGSAYGISLAEASLQVYLNHEPDLEIKHRTPIFTQFIVIKEEGILTKITGRNRATRSPGVVKVFVKPRKGAYVRTPITMGDRYAYVIAQGETSAIAKERAKAAANEIIFHLTSV